MMKTATTLRNTKTLIRRFPIHEKFKTRWVNDPIPQLKQTLKSFNVGLTNHYEQVLKDNGLTEIPHAYLPNKSITTNAKIHKNNEILIKFDFSKFYDYCRWSYFSEYLYNLIPEITNENEYLIKRLLIDPKTKGLTQGLPVSGALAGLSLVPFWVKLKELLPENIIFTQYSDDLIFSSNEITQDFNVPRLTQVIKIALQQSRRQFIINHKKTTVQQRQFRKVTGVRINHDNLTTPSRKDYRFLRQFLHKLETGNDLESLIAHYNFKDFASFQGKIAFMRSIDETNKINNLLNQYATTCYRHNIFTTWIKPILLNPFETKN